jgi:hypothetical protein
MRIQIPIVVEMTDEQVQAYANDYALDDTRAKTITEDVRSLVLTAVQGLFDGIAVGAAVTIKR